MSTKKFVPYNGGCVVSILVPPLSIFLYIFFSLSPSDDLSLNPTH